MSKPSAAAMRAAKITYSHDIHTSVEDLARVIDAEFAPLVKLLETLVDEAEIKTGFTFEEKIRVPVEKKRFRDGTEYASPHGLMVSGKLILTVKEALSKLDTPEGEG